jgi:hypothetical protein
MLMGRRPSAFTGLGIAWGALILVHALAIAPSGGVAVADQAARIEAPLDGAVVSGRIEIRGTATAADPAQFNFYRVYVGNGRTPAGMRPLGPPGETPVVSGVLAAVDTGLLAPGEALILLSVYEKGGRQTDVSVVVLVQPGPPPTVTLSGPRIVVPPVAAPPPGPQPAAAAAAVEYPVVAMPDVEIPQFEPVGQPRSPIPRLTREFPVEDTLPGDPVQVDPVVDGIDLLRPGPR